MNQEMVLSKTEKGKKELATRGELTVDLRHALILVDGRSTLKELLKKGEGLPHFADSLEMLEQLGLIVPAGANVAVLSTSLPSSLETASQSASGDVALKPQLVLLATNLLGGRAGKIIKKIEDADTKEALVSAIDGCGKVIKLLIDEGKADAFVSSAKDILSRSALR